MNSLMQLASEMTSFVLVASLKATLLLVLILLVQKIFSRFLSPQGRYLLWYTFVIGLVSPVGFEAAVWPQAAVPANDAAFRLHNATEPFPVERAASLQAEGPAPFSVPASVMHTPAPASAETLPPSEPALLPYLWLTGVLVVCAGIAVAVLRFAHLVRRARPAPPGLHAVLRDCMRTTACTRAVGLLESTEITAPMIAGHWRPVLLLPAGLEQRLTSAQLRHVFIHELMHLQRGDILGNWVVALVQAVHWFNPLVWFAFHRMRQDRELACDAATLRYLATAEHAAYGHTLLQLNDMLPGARAPSLALAMLHASTPLHRRILLLGSASKRGRWHSIVAMLVFIPLAAVALSQPAVKAAASAAVAPPADAPAVPASSAVETAAIPAAAPGTAPAAEVTSAAAPEPVFIPSPAQAGQTVSAEEAPAIAAVAATTETLAASDAGSADLVLSDEPVAIIAAAPLKGAMDEMQSAAGNAVALESEEALQDIAQLSLALAQTRTDSLAFIEKWEAIGNQCKAREGRFLGALSASCQRIRTAQRRGEMFRFAFTCYQLNEWHAQLLQNYSSVVPQPGVAAALQANARELEEFCSKDTYDRRYPAFASMIADAEALKYFPSSTVVSAGVMVTRMDAAIWRNGMMNTATSMFYTGANQPGPMETLGTPAAPGPGFGNFSVGGSSGEAAPAPAVTQ